MFFRKYYIYGIFGVIVVCVLIVLEPILTPLLFIQTAPPIKVYKAIPLDEKEGSKKPRPSGGEKQSLRLNANESSAAEMLENDNVDGDQVSGTVRTVEEVTLPPPRRIPTPRPVRKELSPAVIAARQAQAASRRLREIDVEMRAIIPFIEEDKDLYLRYLDLEEESLRIHQDSGTLHVEGMSPFVFIKIERMVLRFMTDGKIPVSIGEELASTFAASGLPAQAERIRVLTQRAIQNGDDFYKPEHMEDN